VFPDLFQPNVNLPVVSLALDGENAFLLLQFMRYLIKKKKIPMFQTIQSLSFTFFLNIEQCIFFEQTCVLRKVLGIVLGFMSFKDVK
jgi:hypothetical protein